MERIESYNRDPVKELCVIVALLLDLANIAGGFLLTAGLLRLLPRLGDDVARFAARVSGFGWIIGIIALVAAGYYVIVHLVAGPHLFHFEVVGIGVGLALLWDRLTGKQSSQKEPDDRVSVPTGVSLLLAIFGFIAIIVGIQGLFTPDG